MEMIRDSIQTSIAIWSPQIVSVYLLIYYYRDLFQDQ